VTRIVGGVLSGRRISVPDGRTVRPTSDRAREALFSALGSARGRAGALDGIRVLDLYAGSGAVGLEAVSRGAAWARLVEKDPRSAAVARANAAALGPPATDRSTVTTAAVETLVAQPCPEDAYDIAFLDPPYATPAGQVARILTRLAENGWLRAAAAVVVERSSHDEPWAWPPGFAADRSRRYGDATLWYGHAAGAEADQQPLHEPDGPAEHR
jgi:16S rRNA (guanine966-N2)-methyltransferase